MKKAIQDTLEALSCGPLFRGEHGLYQENNPRLYTPEIVGELKHWPLGEELTFLLCSGYEERARSSSRVALGSPSDKATAGARRLEDTRCFHGWMIAR